MLKVLSVRNRTVGRSWADLKGLCVTNVTVLSLVSFVVILNSFVNWEVLNYCLIVAKYNVFATSVRNGVQDFDSFLLRLNNKIDILHTIAFRSNRLPQ